MGLYATEWVVPGTGSTRLELKMAREQALGTKISRDEFDDRKSRLRIVHPPVKEDFDLVRIEAALTQFPGDLEDFGPENDGVADV